jgi:basic membrane protein A and related proteins
VLRKRLLPLAALALVAAAAFAVFGGAGAAAPKPAKAKFSAALVSDVGRFNDKGFNQNQLTGLKKAAAVLKVKTNAVESHAASDYIPNMAAMARGGANIVIAAGFLLADAEKTVATKFPKTKFAITDYDVKGAPFNGKLKNIEGLTYASQEQSYLVGCLAALMAKKAGGNQISVVGGVKIPPVDTFIAGYQAGANKCVPGTIVKIDYSQDFLAQDKCKELALNQIAAGSKVVFNVAGPCGLGTLSAAKEKGVWGIGVDVDQSYLGPHILTSAVKRVDTGVFLAIKGAMTGKGFKGGSNLVFNLKNGGVGLGKISPQVPAAYITQINTLKKQIIAGKIKPPTVVQGG